MNGLSHNGYYVFTTLDSEHPLALYSNLVTGYTSDRYFADSETSRLLKRAEFLKAVCEKEGVGWLPTERGRWNPALCSCGGKYCPDKTKPERDYYTKAEIDEKLRSLCLL